MTGRLLNKRSALRYQPLCQSVSQPASQQAALLSVPNTIPSSATPTPTAIQSLIPDVPLGPLRLRKTDLKTTMF
jgi:hypothetical protein